MTSTTEKLEQNPIRIGVSTCLLGESVRYDGGHKHDRFLTGTLANMVTFVPVCPEVELGLSTPRPTLRLIEGEDGPRLVFNDSGDDITAKMRRWAVRRVRDLEKEDLCGYILKSKSPSCGMERVKVYVGVGRGKPSNSSSSGLYAGILMEHSPLLPIEEEGRLHDPPLRENFFERVFGYHRLKQLFRPRWRIGDLVRFHTEEKLFLLCHSPEEYRRLGRMVAQGKGMPRDELREHYGTGYMLALQKRGTRGRHINVMQHMLGYFRNDITTDERAELDSLMAEYRQGMLPLIVPLTMFRHFAQRLGVDYLTQQSYLHPHPRELMLRNHV